MTEEAVSINVGEVVENGLDTGFSMATKAGNWIFTNPFASFIVGLGFTFMSFKLFRSAIRAAKRT